MTTCSMVHVKYLFSFLIGAGLKRVLLEVSLKTTFQNVFFEIKVFCDLST